MKNTCLVRVELNCGCVDVRRQRRCGFKQCANEFDDMHNTLQALIMREGTRKRPCELKFTDAFRVALKIVNVISIDSNCL